jgi:4-methyl-5(b-hydroxyethyl)-thiazole monophosphate biosynthesis
VARIAVLLAEGFEEVEAVTPIDFLRRAGVEVVTAGVGGRAVTGSHGIAITADVSITELPGATLDGVVLPGGMPGSVNLAASPEVRKLVESTFVTGRLLAAICAAPAKVLAPMGLLSGRRATCFPGEETAFGSDVEFSEERVVRDGNLITSRGAGTAAEFAEELIRYLVGDDTADEIHLRTVQKA